MLFRYTHFHGIPAGKMDFDELVLLFFSAKTHELCEFYDIHDLEGWQIQRVEVFQSIMSVFLRWEDIFVCNDVQGIPSGDVCSQHIHDQEGWRIPSGTRCGRSQII